MGEEVTSWRILSGSSEKGLFCWSVSLRGVGEGEGECEVRGGWVYHDPFPVEVFQCLLGWGGHGVVGENDVHVF